MLRLNMGRLFWKFFVFFFLSQLCVGLGIGLTLWLNSRNFESTGIEATPPARSVVEAAFATLQYGGVDGLHALLERWQKRRMPQVYAVDETGKDILDRPLSSVTVQAAIEAVETFANERYVIRFDANNGHRYLIFVPKFSREGQAANNPSSSNNEALSQGVRKHHPPQLQLEESTGEALTGPPLPEDIDHPAPRRMRFFSYKPLMSGAVVSLFFAALLAWYFSKPIRHLRRAFEEAANGHLDTRIGNAMGKRRDELVDLGRDFDSMAGRLGNLMRSQTRLLHHVSHELRSPLARLQMAIGLARQSPEKISSSLDRIERESERMDKLVGELLELSRLESGVINLDLQEVDVSELLSAIVEDARYEVESLFKDGVSKPNIKLILQAHFVVQGQPDLLHRAIENIVRNALKYGSANGQIVLEVNHAPVASISQDDKPGSKSKTMQLTIRDNGPGVLEAELESIFQPFVRGSTAGNGDGHGVGLAIARQVIEAHGGTISASNGAAKKDTANNGIAINSIATSAIPHTQTANGGHAATSRDGTGFSVEITLPYVSVLPV